MTELADETPVPLATAEFLTARRDTGTESGFPEDDVILEGAGKRVRVRGLSRHEVLHVQNQKGIAAVEALTVSLGLIAPRMTIEQVKAWQKSSVGEEMDPVTQRIGELSGMLTGSRKQAMKDLLNDPGAQFRAHAGDEAGDDDRAHAPGDVAP